MIVRKKNRFDLLAHSLDHTHVQISYQIYFGQIIGVPWALTKPAE